MSGFLDDFRSFSDRDCFRHLQIGPGHCLQRRTFISHHYSCIYKYWAKTRAEGLRGADLRIP